MPQKPAKIVTELVPNLKPIVQYCKRFAESARFECIFLKDPEVDPQIVYRNTFALGLFCVARNIIGSSNALIASEEFGPINDALNQISEVSVPKRLQDLANFYGRFETQDIIVTYKRLEDFLLRILDLAVNHCNDPGLDKETSRIPFYNTPQFSINLLKHLQAQLDLIADRSYRIFNKDPSILKPIETMVRMPKLDLRDLNEEFIKQFSSLLDCPTNRLREIKELSGIITPSTYSEQYAEIQVWFKNRSIDHYAKSVQAAISEINKFTIPSLVSLYDCSVYVPKNEGSNKQILTRQEIMSYCLDKKAANISQGQIDSDTVIGLYFNPECSVFSENSSEAVNFLERTLKMLALE